jgi:hypothetical protein
MSIILKRIKKQVEGVWWSHMAQNRDQAVGACEDGKSFSFEQTGLETISLSRGILPYVIS